MTVLLVLAFFIFFLSVDWFRTHPIHLPKGTMVTTPGFEMLGVLAQDGGDKVGDMATKIPTVTTQDGNEG